MSMSKREAIEGARAWCLPKTGCLGIKDATPGSQCPATCENYRNQGDAQGMSGAYNTGG
jgi:hypothetical protein